MRRAAFLGMAVVALAAAHPALGANGRVAALQVGLRAKGLYAGPIDGVRGPLTKAGLIRLQRTHGIRPTGRVGARTRRALGVLGRPLLGQRKLWPGLVGWDVSALEFRLVRFGLAPAAVDGRFDWATAAALSRFQRSRALTPDGIAGKRTFHALARPAVRRARPARRIVHVVTAGESFFSIAARFHVSPWLLARENNLRLTGVIVPGQRLRLPKGATTTGTMRTPASRTDVRGSLDYWSRVYGVDP